MINIHEILKGYGLEIPTDKKAEFDKALSENYKTVAEVEKINEKLNKEISDHKETKSTLDNTLNDFEELKNKNASSEDWKVKYEALVKENKQKAEEKERQELELKTRSDFDNYFAEQKKEWNNPMIAEGYFYKYKDAITLEENKNKTTGDILHTMTKDDATAFKVAQPEVKLKGATGGIDNKDVSTMPTIF